MEKEITTIKLSKKIVEELSKIKIHPRQAYEEVIAKLLELYKKSNISASKKEKEQPSDKKEITTIKLSKKIVEELSKIKIHPRQAYEEVIAKLLELYEGKND